MDMGGFLKKKKESSVVFYSFHTNLLKIIPIKIYLGA